MRRIFFIARSKSEQCVEIQNVIIKSCTRNYIEISRCEHTIHFSSKSLCLYHLYKNKNYSKNFMILINIQIKIMDIIENALYPLFYIMEFIDNWM